MLFVGALLLLLLACCTALLWLMVRPGQPTRARVAWGLLLWVFAEAGAFLAWQAWQ